MSMSIMIKIGEIENKLCSEEITPEQAVQELYDLGIRFFQPDHFIDYSGEKNGHYRLYTQEKQHVDDIRMYFKLGGYKVDIGAYWKGEWIPPMFNEIPDLRKDESKWDYPTDDSDWGEDSE